LRCTRLSEHETESALVGLASEGRADVRRRPWTTHPGHRSVSIVVRETYDPPSDRRRRWSAEVVKIL